MCSVCVQFIALLREQGWKLEFYAGRHAKGSLEFLQKMNLVEKNLSKELMILALLTAVFQFSQIDKLIEITTGDNKCDQSYFHVGFAKRVFVTIHRLFFSNLKLLCSFDFCTEKGVVLCSFSTYFHFFSFQY